MNDISIASFLRVWYKATGTATTTATYHDLVVEQRDDIWYGRVYFDV